MYHWRVTSVIFSSMRRNISPLTASKVDGHIRLVLFNEKLSKAYYRRISTSFSLLSSEVPAKKPTGEELSVNHNELNFGHIGKQLNDDNAANQLNDHTDGELSVDQSDEELNVDKNDELDSKIGKYAELAVDSEEKKKILMILMEHEVAKLEGKKVPSKLSVEGMKELLNMYSYSSRLKYMGFLFEKELRKDAEKRRKEFKRKEREVWLVEKQNIKPAEHIQYGISHNTLLIRIRRKSLNRFRNQRMANAVLYGQKIIIDMDYDCFMRKRDCNNCGEQLLELYSANRKSRNPFDLLFCNVDLSSTTMSSVSSFMPNLYSPDNFISVSELSYLDLFPKEKLVYITPYAKEPLRTYDHNAIYILGGLVDKSIKEPVVLAKAKREGIKAVHLPFDEYLMWGRSNKSLPLNQIMEILLEMKSTNDWNKAFRFVPQRKLVRSLDLFSEF